MADDQGGSSTSSMPGGSPDSTVELNVKTLDSQIYKFDADQNIPVSAFKEKIAGQIGVPREHQRLIFRGKVLKDDHLLSEYHLENGDTLHLVIREPSQPQALSSSNTGDSTTTNSGREPGIGGPRGRLGQISQSVVLGTFNVGEQGEGAVPDLSRVIGAVLNSIGVGNQTGTQPSLQFNAQVQSSQRTDTEGVRNNAAGQNQAGSQSQPGNPFSGQALPQVVQIPLGAAIAVPSLNVPIPDSLNTLSEFMNRMELVLSQNGGNQSSQSPNVTGAAPTTELPSNSRGIPSPETLSIVLRHAQRLISGPTVEALSHIAGRLEQEAGSTNPTVRGQIQTESVRLGLAMQHLGALLLELGRTTLTLRMGQSPTESSVNAGPAVYISPAGPNPIMVQPFPLQTSSLFGSSAYPNNPGPFGPVGIGNTPRHVNIHIHAATSLAPLVPGVEARTTNGEGTQGQHASGAYSGDPGQAHALPMRNIVATAVSPPPPVIAVSGTGVGVSQPPSDSFPISAVMSEVNSQIRNFVDNMRNEHQAVPESSTVQDQSIGCGARNDDRRSQPNISYSYGLGEPNQSFPGVSQMEDQKAQPESNQPCNSKDTGNMDSKSEPSSSSIGGTNPQSRTPKVANVEGFAGSSQGMETADASSSVPLGLGLGGLQPKRRNRQSKLQGNNGDGSSLTSNQTEQPVTAGQQVLQSLASLPRNNTGTQPSGQSLHSTAGFMDGGPTRDENADGQLDVASAMSQVLQSPALNGLLTGVSQQTGVGSPNALRNMMQQITQNPAMRSTVNQIAQQIDNHDLGSMFAGLGGGQGGGFDLSRMVQQMMPIVSQALGGVSTTAPQGPSSGPDLTESRSRREVASFHENSQIDLRQVIQRIERQSPPGEIFNSVVRNVARLYEGGSGRESVVNELCSEEALANDFVEMLRHDISWRIQEESGP